MVVERRPNIEVLYHYYCEFDAIYFLHYFAEDNLTPTEGLSTNFIGVKIPTKIHPQRLAELEGTVEGLPIPSNWHADIAEWASALRAVTATHETFRLVELGCGWGCWLVNLGTAARKMGFKVDLIGIEGDRNHLANAEEVLKLNGFEESDFQLVHGIAAAKEGKAIFPDPEAGSAEWGGEAIFYPSDEELNAAQNDASVQVLECYPLEKLSQGKEIDVLHIDIQGAEVDYVKGNFESLKTYVRRVLIGTHSRAIEGALHEIFLDAGWLLEMERPARINLHNGRPSTGIDGVQMWVNPELVR